MISISIIIPCLNEEKYISYCLDSVISSDYPKEFIEVLIVDGMSTDKTREIIKEYQNKFNFIKLIDNIKKIVPVAMNIGIQKANGDYIIRLDAHSNFPNNYFSQLIEYSKKLNADNIGAILETDIKNKNKKSNSIKEILSHKLGVGNSLFRVGAKKIQKVDTVPFGCYKKEVFSKYGLYDQRLIRNQDIELNRRIINNGGTIYLIPSIKATYFARENFKALGKNNFLNGYWNILTAYYTKSLNSLSLRHFIPLIFILSLIFPLILTILNPLFIWISFISFISYLTLVIIISFKLKREENSFFYLLGSFLTLHFSYGFGSLIGIFSTLTKIIKGKK